MGSSRCAELLGGGRKNAVLWGSSRCAGLLDQRKEEAAFGGGGGGGCSIERGRRLLCAKAALGGAPAAWGCPIEGGRRLLWGSSRYAGLLDQRKRLLHGDLPLLRCAELLGWGRKETAFGGSSRCVGC